MSIILLASAQADIVDRPPQAVGVKGRLTCKGVPAEGVLVKLYDYDTLTLDDLMAKGQTDKYGYFNISGHANEITSITPKLNIYHDCDDIWPCQRRISIYVPKDHVVDGKEAAKFYEIGEIELSGAFDGESRDCFH